MLESLGLGFRVLGFELGASGFGVGCMMAVLQQKGALRKTVLVTNC